jgi:uncharacterized protein (DUF983 family)
MEQLYWKIDLPATCPHCGEASDYVFYLNADSLICNKCEKEFNIELWARDVEVRASK